MQFSNNRILDMGQHDAMSV